MAKKTTFYIYDIYKVVSSTYKKLIEGSLVFIYTFKHSIISSIAEGFIVLLWLLSCY